MMRDLETLAKEIDVFILERAIVRREKRTGEDGREIVTEHREPVPPGRGISDLAAHIRANWTIDEVLFFAKFTHCGTFVTRGGGWRIEFPVGYQADTAEGQSNLVALFARLQAETWAFAGAFAQCCGAECPAEILEKSADMGGMSLSQLARLIPKGTVATMLARIDQNAAIAASAEKQRQKNRQRAGRAAAASREEAERGAEEKPYKRRVAEAVAQVARKVQDSKHPWGAVLPACEYICEHFGEKRDPRTGKVIITGGLRGLDGRPMKPGRLRDIYYKRAKSRKK
jgi:hypothetical protein